MGVYLLTSSNNSQLDHIKQYVSFLDQNPHLQHIFTKASIPLKIITQYDQIVQIEKKTFLELVHAGLDEDRAFEQSRAGIVARDQYLIWLRDPVICPDGRQMLYKRISYPFLQHGCGIVAALPTYQGRVGLIKIWRHATQSWEFEIPRGSKLPGETLEQAVLRELEEEMRVEVDELRYLGTINPDSGLIGAQIAVYSATLNKLPSQLHQGNPDEFIESVHFFTLEEIHTLLVKGCKNMIVRDTLEPVYLRDPFFTYALYLSSNLGINL